MVDFGKCQHGGEQQRSCGREAELRCMACGKAICSWHRFGEQPVCIGCIRHYGVEGWQKVAEERGPK